MNIAQEWTVQQLRHDLGQNEATEHLIDWLCDAWDTLEILRDFFGDARALHIFTAHARVPQTTERPAVLV